MVSNKNPKAQQNQLNLLRRFHFLILILLLQSLAGFSQLKGRFYIDTFKISNWPAIHSFSFAQYDHYILLIGGRKDGLHPRESGFEYNQSNQMIYLWNTKDHSIISYRPDSLDPFIHDFLSASNTNFTQDDQFLYITGGYGQSRDGVYKTFPVFLRVDLKKCVEGILTNQTIFSSMKYIRSDYFAVAGAQMRIMDSLFYLVGGQLFSAKYDHNNHSLNQKYTDAVRIFKITDEGDSLKVNSISEIINDFNFHRRDYNLNPTISENGEVKLMVYSGVFQYNINRPFLNISIIHDQTFDEVFDFEHKFASYNCARFACYDHLTNEFHQLFFGGMAEYYRDSVNNIAQDPYVPFVKSISSISRKSDGSLVEHLYENELPGFFGTNSEFLINPNLNIIYQDIVDFSSFNKDTTYLGIVYGGIYNPSKMKNPWQNDSAHLTMSNPYLLKIYFIKDQIMSDKNKQASPDKSAITLIPNPAKHEVRIELPKDLLIKTLKVRVQDTGGHIIKTVIFGALPENKLVLNTSDLIPQNYNLLFLVNSELQFQKQLSIFK